MFSKTSTGTTSSLNAASDGGTGVNLIIEGPSLPPIPPTAKRLFLVRHGEVINPGGDRPVFYGGADVPLSPLGEEEATAAALYLQQFTLAHVASSPLSRAMFGAKEVHKLQNNPDNNDDDVLVFKGLTELDRGTWYGKTKEEIGVDNLAKFDACDVSVTPEGGENYPELKERVLAARDVLLALKTTGTASAVVSHLQVTRCILSDALGIPTSQMTTLPIATASVSCVDYYDDGDASVLGWTTVHFQSFKPSVGLTASMDGAN
jgi:broad specificity phosphatase PhoE